jgi:DNA-binding beta-propeller fold protein YncE
VLREGKALAGCCCASSVSSLYKADDIFCMENICIWEIMVKAKKAWIYLSLLGCVFLSSCAEDTSGDPIPDGKLHYPAGLAIHPQGYAFVASANFDLSYQSGSLDIIDLRGLAEEIKIPVEQRNDPYYRQYILSEKSIGIGSFAGSVALSNDGKLLAVTTRDNDELVLVDVDVQTNGARRSVDLNCWKSKRPDEASPLCDKKHYRVELAAHDTGEVKKISTDPFDIVILDADPTGNGSGRVAFVSMLYGITGSMVAVDIPFDAAEASKVRRFITGIQVGVFDLAFSQGNGFMYASPRASVEGQNNLIYFDPYDKKLGTARTDFYSQTMGSGIRSIAFSEGQTGAVVFQNPDSLVKIDVSLDDGVPKNAYLDSVGLTSQPSRVRAWGDWFFVTCALDDTIIVVNRHSWSIESIFEGTCIGAFDIGFWQDSESSWAIVSCFSENTIAIIDVDPSSDTLFDTLLKVGEPR